MELPCMSARCVDVCILSYDLTYACLGVFVHLMNAPLAINEVP